MRARLRKLNEGGTNDLAENVVARGAHRLVRLSLHFERGWRPGGKGTQGAISGSVGGGSGHGGGREDVCLRGPGAGVETQGPGVRIRPLARQMGREEEDGAAIP